MQHLAHGAKGTYPLPPAYLTLLVEATKILVCGCGLLVRTARTGQPSGLSRGGLAYSLRFAVPAVIYTFMNVLTLVGNTYLSPPTLQLLGNMKILATSVVSLVLLKRTTLPHQWVALVLLTAGAMLGSGGDARRALVDDARSKSFFVG